MTAPFKICLARFPGQNQEHPDSAGYMMKLAARLARDDLPVVPFRLSDTPITMSRNRAVRFALEAGCDYLLMLDADMGPDPARPDGSLAYPGAVPFWDAAYGFLTASRDKFPAAVAAPYCGPSPDQCVYVFEWKAKKAPTPDVTGAHFKLAMFDREQAAIRGGIEEVAALPTGLILYDTRVFRTMPPPWFYYEWKDQYQDQKASTEDVTQTRDMSLAWHMSGGAIGGRCYCAWDSWAEHIKLEHVGKPVVIPVDTIAATLAKAVRAGWKDGTQVRVVGDIAAEFASVVKALGAQAPLTHPRLAQSILEQVQSHRKEPVS